MTTPTPSAPTSTPAPAAPAVTEINSATTAEMRRAFQDFRTTGDLKVKHEAFGTRYSGLNTALDRAAGLDAAGQLTGELGTQFGTMEITADLTSNLKESMNGLKEMGLSSDGMDRLIKNNLSELQREANKIGYKARDAVKRHAEAITKLTKGGEKLTKTLTSDIFKREMEDLKKTYAADLRTAGTDEALKRAASEKYAQAVQTLGDDLKSFGEKIADSIKGRITHHTDAINEIKGFVGKLEENGVKIPMEARAVVNAGTEVARTAENGAAHAAEREGGIISKAAKTSQFGLGDGIALGGGVVLLGSGISDLTSGDPEKKGPFAYAKTAAGAVLTGWKVPALFNKLSGAASHVHGI